MFRFFAVLMSYKTIEQHHTSAYYASLPFQSSVYNVTDVCIVFSNAFLFHCYIVMKNFHNEDERKY